MVPAMAAEEPSKAPAPQLRGLWFEAFEVGQSHVSAARTITEADIAAFACLSGDFNPIHVDQTFADRTAFRSRIAHGLLVESVASGLAAQMNIFHGTIAALAEVDIRFLLPVKAGDTIHVELEVTSIDPEPKKSRGHVHFATHVFNQRGEMVLDGRWDTLMLRERRRRPARTESSS